MRLPKPLLVLLALPAVVLAGCQATGSTQSASKGRGYDPRDKPIKCIAQKGVAGRKVGRTTLQVGAPDQGPKVVYVTTPEFAASLQLHGHAEGAEVIGRALLYPQSGNDQQLKIIENCLGKDLGESSA
jgi:hypothetical protein